MRKLENKVAIITGAGSGIGRATAILYLQEGCKVVAVDINRNSLDSLRKEMVSFGEGMETLVADVENESDIEKMFKVALDSFGTLDILVNNAGVMDNYIPAGEADDKLWDHIIAVNLTGPFKAMRRAINIMLPKGSGCIVNITSLGGISSTVAGAAYTSSKHGVIGLTKNAGFMYAKKGIRCNAIAPGGVATNIMVDFDVSKMNSIAKDRILPTFATIPRQGKSEEIARIALFLASDDSRYINGSVIIADGGWKGL